MRCLEFLILLELMCFAAHREMTGRLQFAAEHRQAALVTGDAGTGKTTAIRAVMKHVDDSRYRFMYIASRSLSPKTLYRELLERLQIQLRFRHTDNQTLARHAFEESFHRGVQWVIAIDEAHELDASMLAEFRFLLNFRTDSFSPLSLWRARTAVSKPSLWNGPETRCMDDERGRVGV